LNESYQNKNSQQNLKDSQVKNYTLKNIEDIKILKLNYPIDPFKNSKEYQNIAFKLSALQVKSNDESLNKIHFGSGLIS